jgi:acetolactate synthase small subunit
LKKGKLPEVAEVSAQKVTVDSDVMNTVNQKLTEMMKIINKQQAEIEQLRKNDMKMLDVVETSHENNEALEEKIKLIQRENKKLLKHEQRNTRRYITLKEENKKLTRTWTT